jgi:hypothetical protein
MALRLSRVGSITRPTRGGSRHPAILLRYLQSLGKHCKDRGHEGGGNRYLINNEVSMADSIYPRAETHHITDYDNDSIKGIHTSAVAPTHAGPRLPSKKPHASGKNSWTCMKAANIFTSIQGQGLCISHTPLAMMGQDKAGWGIHPHIRELHIRVGGMPARPR